MNPDAPLPGLDDPGPVGGRSVVRCGMCGRPLTDPAARRWGLGEQCRHKLHPGPAVRTPGRFDVEQEELPEG